MDTIDKMLRLKKMNREVQINNSSPVDYNYDGYQFYCIDKIVLSEDLTFKEKCEYLYEAAVRFIQAMKALETSLIYRIKSDTIEGKLHIYLGISKHIAVDPAEIFRTYFQNVRYHEADDVINYDNVKAQAIVTGIPFMDKEGIPQDHIGAVMKIMKGKNVNIEIVAKPVRSGNIKKQFDYLLKEKSENSEAIKRVQTSSTGKTETFSSSKAVAKTDGKNQTVVIAGTNTSYAETQTDSDSDATTNTSGENRDIINAFAEEYNKLLELHTDRLTKSLTSGLWQCCILVSCEEDITLKQVCSVFASSYNKDSVESFTSHNLQGKCSIQSVYSSSTNSYSSENIFTNEASPFSYLNGEELAVLLDLPKEEYYGYEIDFAPRFSQNLRVDHTLDCFQMGQLYDGEVISTIDFSLNKETLGKHLLVAGITGSGKTNTVFNILKNIELPFLVLEPAKKEYRALKAVIPDLRVYTLGDETTSPFRLNPFYFGKNINIQQHIDNMKVIFIASFAMYAPMPNILEQCLNNIYIKKGWSLTTSENIYEKDGVLHPEYYPTIEDLYYEIDAYMNKLGYAQEQTQNIRAALLTRIRSLMIGGKGFLLNTIETIDIEELLAYPTVLELEAVADDDEKSLIIGFIAMNIYEHLKSNVKDYNGGLKHLLVFEEAHRTFKNVSQVQSEESSNIRGKAVENLSNILCEVRAYGQGMLIVDQVPTKLAPDVMKNTNTKIIHRLVSKDDCDYVSNSLGLKENEISYISKLANGSTLVLSEGMSYPAHVKIKYEKDNLHFVEDKEVKRQAISYNELAENPHNIHPLTDLLMQRNPLEQELQSIGKKLYKNFLQGDMREFHSYVLLAKKEFIDYAYHQGFDINIKREVFINSIMEETLNYVIKTEESLVNNLSKRLKHKKYNEACLYISDKNYEENKKEYKLLELSRKKLM